MLQIIGTLENRVRYLAKRAELSPEEYLIAQIAELVDEQCEVPRGASKATDAALAKVRYQADNFQGDDIPDEPEGVTEQ